MKVRQVIDTVYNFFAEEFQKPGQVIAVLGGPEGWRVKIEVAEEVEYMRRRGRDDLMAVYEVLLNPALEIVGFERKFLRERNSIQPAENED